MLDYITYIISIIPVNMDIFVQTWKISVTRLFKIQDNFII